MSFDNATNHKRADKIQETLELIQKSAQTNGATPDEIWAMLQGPIDTIQTMVQGGSPATAETQEEPPKVDSTAPSPSYIQIREAAQTASLKDLTYAMAVFMTRIDEHLHS